MCKIGRTTGGPVAGVASELDQVSDLCGRIDWSGLEGNIAGGVLEPIAGFFGAETASFRWLSRSQEKPKPVTLGIPESVNDAYA